MFYEKHHSSSAGFSLSLTPSSSRSSSPSSSSQHDGKNDEQCPTLQSPKIERLREKKRDLERRATAIRLSTPKCPITARRELSSRHDDLWTPGAKKQLRKSSVSPALARLREQKRCLEVRRGGAAEAASSAISPSSVRKTNADTERDANLNGNARTGIFSETDENYLCEFNSEAAAQHHEVIQSPRTIHPISPQFSQTKLRSTPADDASSAERARILADRRRILSRLSCSSPNNNSKHKSNNCDKIRCGKCHQCQSKQSTPNSLQKLGDPHDQLTTADNNNDGVVKCLVGHFEEAADVHDDEHDQDPHHGTAEAKFQMVKFDLSNTAKDNGDESTTAPTHLSYDGGASAPYSQRDGEDAGVNASSDGHAGGEGGGGDTVSSLGSASYLQGSQSNNTIISSVEIAQELEFVKKQLQLHGDTLNELAAGKRNDLKGRVSGEKEELSYDNVDDSESDPRESSPLSNTATHESDPDEHDVPLFIEEESSPQHGDDENSSYHTEEPTKVETLQLELYERNLQVAQLLEEVAQLKLEKSPPEKADADGNPKVKKKKIFSANFAFGEAKRAVKGSINEVQDLETEFKLQMEHFAVDFDKVLSDLYEEDDKKPSHLQAKQELETVDEDEISLDSMNKEFASIVAGSRAIAQEDAIVDDSQGSSQMGVIINDSQGSSKEDALSDDLQGASQYDAKVDYSPESSQQVAINVDSREASQQDAIIDDSREASQEENGSPESSQQDAIIDDSREASQEEDDSPESSQHDAIIDDSREASQEEDGSPESSQQDAIIDDSREASQEEDDSPESSKNDAIIDYSREASPEEKVLQKEAKNNEAEQPQVIISDETNFASSLEEDNNSRENIEEEAHQSSETISEKREPLHIDTINSQVLTELHSGVHVNPAITNSTSLHSIDSTFDAIRSIEETLAKQKNSEQNGIHQLEHELKSVREDIARLANAIQQTTSTATSPHENNSTKKSKNRLKSLKHALSVRKRLAFSSKE